MSTYSNVYNDHPFHKEWKKVVQTTNLIKEEIDSDISPDLARFITIVHFIDEQVNSINPEVIPLNEISTKLNQLTVDNRCGGIHSNLTQYRINSELSNIAEANSNIDYILSAFYPYFIIPNAGGMTAFKRISTTFHNKVEKDVESFNLNSNKVYQKMEDRYNELEQKSNEIESFHKQIFGITEGTGEKAEIDEAIKTMRDQFNEIKILHKDLLYDDESTSSLSADVKDAVNTIEQQKDKAAELKDNADTIVKELSDFRDDMLGEEDEHGKRFGGMAGDLEILKSELEQFKSGQDKVYNALKARIESLLPGATSAGLASAYSDMKNHFTKPIKTASNQFYGAIAGLIILSILSIVQSYNPLEFIKINEWEEIIKTLAIKSPLYIPLVWFAIYAQRRRSESARLYQEYAHKEAIAKSYDGYKKQIEELQDDENKLLSKLMNSAINAIAYNASVTLEKGHNESTPLGDAVDKFNPKNIIKKTESNS